MSIFDRFRRREERAATLSEPPAWLMSALGVGGKTASGRKVSVQTALGLVPVFSAVSLISSTVGSLPLIVYRRTPEGRERATGHRSWMLLHSSPNEEMAADELWEIITSHLLLWGNAFIYRKMGPLGRVEELWPVEPSRVQVGRDRDGRRYFSVDGKGPFYEDTILHIRGLSSDGLVGYSPIQIAKQAIANALAQEDFQGKFLSDQGRPSVILRHPNTLKVDAAKRLKASWDAIEAGGTAVLEEDTKVEKWTMPLEDAQFLESMQFSDLRIAQLFQLPPSKLGAKTGDSLTYSTTELAGIDLITYTLRRWLVRVEGALLRDPSLFPDPSGFFPEFLVEGLLRADANSRAAFYTQALNAETGWLTRAEVRRLENMPAEPTIN